METNQSLGRTFRTIPRITNTKSLEISRDFLSFCPAHVSIMSACHPAVKQMSRFTHLAKNEMPQNGGGFDRCVNHINVGNPSLILFHSTANMMKLPTLCDHLTHPKPDTTIQTRLPPPVHLQPGILPDLWQQIEYPHQFPAPPETQPGSTCIENLYRHPITDPIHNILIYRWRGGQSITGVNVGAGKRVTTAFAAASAPVGEGVNTHTNIKTNPHIKTANSTAPTPTQAFQVCLIFPISFSTYSPIHQLYPSPYL